MKRKLFLLGFGIAFIFVFLVHTIPAQEVIYLADSAEKGDESTLLFKVDLDPSSGLANLTLIYDMPFDQVDALACTPDGTKIYAIDKYRYLDPFLGDGGQMGYYEPETGDWTYLPYVKCEGNIVPEIVLAAFSPDGILYAASDATDSLYTIDTTTAVATWIGEIKYGVHTVNVSGADIVFAAEDAGGAFYFWANRAKEDPNKNLLAPRGLYELTLPSTPGTVTATYLGATGEGDYFTGLAIRANGFGDLVGSTHEDKIFIVDKTDGSTRDILTMTLDGVTTYDYIYGDMTAGALSICTKTIGYWKNHDWNGAVVTICGQEINEPLGKEILGNAKSKNFSMFFAQLIAAKLNVNNATGVSLIDEAEAWLCSTFCEDDECPNIENIYYSPFTSKDQKKEAEEYWKALDEFNNSNPCEDDSDNYNTQRPLRRK